MNCDNDDMQRYCIGQEQCPYSIWGSLPFPDKMYDQLDEVGSTGEEFCSAGNQEDVVKGPVEIPSCGQFGEAVLTGHVSVMHLISLDGSVGASVLLIDTSSVRTHNPVDKAIYSSAQRTPNHVNTGESRGDVGRNVSQIHRRVRFRHLSKTSLKQKLRRKSTWSALT